VVAVVVELIRQMVVVVRVVAAAAHTPR